MSKRRNVLYMLAFLAAAALALPVFAQTTDPALQEVKQQLLQATEALKQQQAVIEALQKRVSELEMKQAAAAQAAPAPQPAPAVKPPEIATKAESKAAPAEEKYAITNQVGNWKITFGGTVFANYSYSLYTDPASKTYARLNDFNQFQLQRCYLDVRGQMGQWAFRATPDVYTTLADGMAVRMKFAYLDYKFNNAATVRGGMVPTPWEAFTAPLYGYRYQGKLMPDKENYMPTADLGVGVLGKPNKYVEYSVDVVNGLGFTKPETDKYKTLQARLTLTPFEDTAAKGLGFSLYEEYGKEDAVWDKKDITGIRSRQIGMIFYKRGIFTAGSEYMWTRDLAASRVKYEPSLLALKGGQAKGELWDAWFTLKFPSKWGILARYDSVDPSTDIADNSHWRGIFGVSYDFNKSVALLLDEEFTQYQPGAKMTATDKQSLLSLHLQLLW